MDSEATSHVTSQKTSLELLHKGHPNFNISIANGPTHQVSRIGSGTIASSSGEIKLPHVLYVPALRCNLISVGSLVDQGNAIIFTKSQCLILDNITYKRILAIGTRNSTNGLYHFQHQINFSEVNSISNTKSSVELWHKRFGHLHYNGLIHLSRHNRVKGIPFFAHT